MRVEHLCAASMPVPLQVSEGPVKVIIERPAKEWANVLGMQWDTVRQRRFRGDPWSQAFQPFLRRSSFNSPNAVPVAARKKQTIDGAIQMAKLEIQVPSVGHIVIVGVSPEVRAVATQAIQKMMREQFGASVKVELPAEMPAGAEGKIKESLWVVSGD